MCVFEHINRGNKIKCAAYEVRQTTHICWVFVLPLNNWVERMNVVTSALRYQFVLLDELYCVLIAQCVPTIIWLTSNTAEPTNPRKIAEKTKRNRTLTILSYGESATNNSIPAKCATFASATWTSIGLNCFYVVFLSVLAMAYTMQPAAIQVSAK